MVSHSYPSSLQEKQKQLTLLRRKKRQQAQATEAQADSTAKETADYADKAELDDLIAVLKSGEYFDRRRSKRLSTISLTSNGTNPRNSRVLECSRDRLVSDIQESQEDS